MCRVFYALEDYFDLVARERPGRITGWISGVLGRMFALSGDILGLSTLRS